MIFRCFVIMPYHSTSKNIYEILSRCKTIPNFEHEIQFIRADQVLSSIELRSNVMKHMMQCDFAIADVSVMDPNVFVEIGYITALGKPVIFIGNEKSKLPSNLIEENILQYDERNPDQLTTFLPKFIMATIQKIRMPKIADLFIASAYGTVISSDILLAIKNARERIDILTINLSSIFSIGIESEIEAVLKKSKIRLRILTLDPESILVNMRAKQLGLPIPKYRMELNESIQKALSLFSKHSELCDIRLYDELPYQILYRVDNHIFLTLIPTLDRSRYGLTFKLNPNDPGVDGSIIFNFEALWSRSIDLHFRVID